MWSRLQITIFVGVAVVAWGSVLYLQGTPLSLGLLTPFSIVVGFLVCLGVLFDRFLWRLRLLHGWLVKRPDLRGTWRVDLYSEHIDPVTEIQMSPISGFAVITQTFTNLQIHLMTTESESWLIADRILPSNKGPGYSLTGVYTNRPKLHLRGNRSEIHLGALTVDTHGTRESRPDKLEGEYWTDRGTKGGIVFSRFTDNIHTRYEDAKSASGQRDCAQKCARPDRLGLIPPDSS